MGRVLVGLAFLLVACSPTNGNPAAQATPSVAVSSAKGSGTANSSSSPDLPLSAVGFSCRLPVMRSSTFGNYTGGFVTFPAATYAADPRAGIASNSQNGVLTTVATPVLSGILALYGPPFYDAAQRRWVPADSGQSTPDGAFYAYSTWDSANVTQAQVHVVNVAQATEKTFVVAVPENAQGFTVADFDAAGVYLMANTFEHLPSGVWLMDSTNGTLRQVTQVGPVAAVRSGFAWLSAIDPHDPAPPQLHRSGTASDSIVRFDLASGAQTTWFYRPGMEVSLLGFGSAGQPIVYVTDPSGSSNHTEVWLSGGPGSTGTLVYSGNQLYIVSPQGDGDRIWFGGYTGIYLYTQSHGLQKVVAFNDLQPQESVLPAGFCM